MGFFSEYLRRLWYLVNRRRIERELQREMEAHRAMMGEPRQFGNMLRLREESRDVWGWNWLDDAWRDFRFASRSLRQSPIFTAGAIVVLTLAIGLNLILFQIYNVAVLKPLPIRNLERIVQLSRESERGRENVIPYPAAEYIRSHSSVLETVLTTSRQRYVFWNDSERRWTAHAVSANWFEELGVPILQGRVFHASLDGVPSAPPAVIVTHHFWTTQMNADSKLVGATVRINNRPATVIGILPENTYSGLGFISDSRLFIPIEQIDYFFPGSTLKTDWKGWVDTYARMKPGVPLAAVRESLRPVMAELALEHPGEFKKNEWLEPLPATARFEDAIDRNQRRFVATSFGFLSLLVLTVACANLSNFVLSRGIARLRELHIRLALGASRWRVIRLLIAESIMLAVAADVAGVLLASATLGRIGPMLAGMPFDAAVDQRTLLAAAVIGAVAIIVIGLLPTWTISRKNLGGAIKDGGRHASAGLSQSRLRALLTVVQVAGSSILLLLAGLTARNVYQALRPGIDFEKVAVLGVPVLFDKQMDALSYWSGLKQSVGSLPETDGLAVVQHAPLGTVMTLWREPEAPGLAITVNRVEPQFFELMRIPLIAGRTFTSSDDPTTAVILSKRLAMTAYGRINVLGQRFPQTSPASDKTVKTIIGIVEDAHFIQIDAPNAAELYLPMNADQLRRSAMLIVRARTEPRLLLAPMRDASRAIEPSLLVETRLMSTDYETKFRDRALMSGLAIALGLVTLLLSCIGVFGVISYSAGLRRKEISIRMALGASRSSLLALLMQQSLKPAAIGSIGGFLIGLAAAPVMRGQGVYLGSLDAPILLSVATVIAFTCTAASFWPARRALRIKIAQTLRDE